MKSSDKIKQNMHRPNGSKWWKLVARRSWCQPTTKVLGDDSSTLGCEEHVILPPILLWFEKVLNHIHTNEKKHKNSRCFNNFCSGSISSGFDHLEVRTRASTRCESAHREWHEWRAGRRGEGSQLPSSWGPHWISGGG